MEIKMNDTVRIKGQPKGSMNEFGRVLGVDFNGLIWVSNLNSPFSGTISEKFRKEDLELVK